MNILFVTTSNITMNPRLGKELKLALALGYDATVVCFKFDNWSEKFDQDFFAENPTIQVTKISAGRHPFLPWFCSSLFQLISRFVWYMVPSLIVASLANDKRSYLLSKTLKEMKAKPDLIIGHNLGTLAPIWAYSQRNKIPFGFDMEDYHPDELTDAVHEKKRREQIIRSTLKDARYVSCSAELISKKLKSLLKGKGPGLKVVENIFPRDQFVYCNKNNKKLNFVWFSQNISLNRGLEKFIPILQEFDDKIKLTLIGQLNSDIRQTGLLEKDFIEILPPLCQKDLNKKICESDVGLAIEDEKNNENRNLCLTNKIIAYYQAGLYILATDTLAQRAFIVKRQKPGIICKNDGASIRKALNYILTNRAEIRQARRQRFNDARKYCWESKSKKLSQIWKEGINDTE